MNWYSLSISFIIGLAIDCALVWLFYWWNGEAFQWRGFWIWQAILIGASLLLWLRRLIGFVGWYLIFGREALVSEAFQKYVEFEFEPFNKHFDNIDDWLSKHTQQDRSTAANSLIASALIRQTGLWQYFMLISAYKKAAIRHSNYVERRDHI